MNRFDDASYESISEDMWGFFGINCGGYSSEVDNEVIAIIKDLSEDRESGRYSIDIAKRLSLSGNHVELILYILCSSGIADYGTSPRGCWIDHNIDKARLIRSLETYYVKTWDEPSDGK